MSLDLDDCNWWKDKTIDSQYWRMTSSVCIWRNTHVTSSTVTNPRFRIDTWSRISVNTTSNGHDGDPPVTRVSRSTNGKYGLFIIFVISVRDVLQYLGHSVCWLQCKELTRRVPKIQIEVTHRSFQRSSEHSGHLCTKNLSEIRCLAQSSMSKLKCSRPSRNLSRMIEETDVAFCSCESDVHLDDGNDFRVISFKRQKDSSHIKDERIRHENVGTV